MRYPMPKRPGKIAVQNNERREMLQIKARFKPFLIGLWIFCGVTFFYTVFNFSDVIIDYKMPLLLGGFCGLIGIFFTKKRNNYFFAFLGYGSLFTGILLFINNTFADPKTIEVKLMINQKHQRSRRYGPSVEVKYDNLDKEIGVSSEAEMARSSYIILKLNKGALGYYIIKGSALVKE